MPMVSIIIPLHNSEAFIKDTIQSCLNQSYQNIEVLVVENGSTDQSFKIVQGIKDKRIHLFKIEKANASAARNFGLQKAKGEYIQFLDADDLMSVNKIALQLKTLEKKPKGWLASCAWAKFMKTIKEATIEEQAVWRIENPLEWLVVALTGGGMMIPGCWLLPRSLVEQTGGWDERLSLHDDGEFMCRVLLAAKGNIFVENTCVYYRQVEGSLSKSNQSLSAAQSALLVAQSYEKQLLKIKDNKRIREALARNYCRLIYEYYPRYSEIRGAAEKRLQQLGVSPLPLVGSTNFRILTKYLGFKVALRLSAFRRQLSNTY